MKFIPGYENLYSAEEDGRIYSHLSKKYLTPNYNRRYLKFTFCKNGIRKDENVHRLIALTFIPNPENKPTVDHIDKNKHNNAVSNLRWATCAENSANLPIYKTNTSGEQNIGTKRKIINGKEYVYYSVEYVRKGIIVYSKQFKTLPEAVEARNNYCLLASSNL